MSPMCITQWTRCSEPEKASRSIRGFRNSRSSGKHRFFFLSLSVPLLMSFDDTTLLAVCAKLNKILSIWRLISVGNSVLLLFSFLRGSQNNAKKTLLSKTNQITFIAVLPYICEGLNESVKHKDVKYWDLNSQPQPLSHHCTIFVQHISDPRLHASSACVITSQCAIHVTLVDKLFLLVSHRVCYSELK